ncbi:unnamed protein product [Alternaria alternata]
MAPIYGEQQVAAFRRLRKEIREVTQDQGSPSDGGKRQALMESLRFDQIDARYATIKNAHAKTCKWLLRKSEHTEWLDSTRLSSHHGFLWIKGKPGTGKSTLMKFAFGQAGKSKKSDIVIAFFFNARGETLEKTIIGMYRSLLLQLLEKIPTLQCNPGSLSLVPSSISAGYQWTRHSLEDQLQQAVLSLGETPVIFFIDALDECEQWQVRSMISFFENLGELAVSSGRSFRVCLSSRHYPEVTIQRGIILVLEGQEGHTQDINNYLESALRIGTGASAQKIRKDLQEKSSGVFMWIVLVVDILNKEYDGGRMYALERRLKQIPADLHALFQDILTRDSNDKDELILCLQWVLFAKQPLQPEQLYLAILAGTEPDALTTQHDQEVTFEIVRKFLLRSSKGLTEITKTKNKKVQFIHESVRDFLLKENGLSKIWPEFEINFQGQSHDRLKQCCLNYISIDIASHSKLPDNLPKANSLESKNLSKSVAETFPFLEYAVHNVLYHADTAEGGDISQADFLNSFPLPQWVKIDNLFEKHEIRRHTQSVSLLYILAELNMVNLIRVLGSASCCMDVEAERYGCPVFAAAAMNNEQAVELCLESITIQESYSGLVVKMSEQGSQSKSARREFVYSKSKHFLLNALIFGHHGVIAVSIASRGLETGSHNREVLRWACRTGCEMLARLILVGDFALVNGRDSDTEFPIQVAAKSGNLGMVEMLLGMGANVNAFNATGPSLYWASQYGYKEIVGLLIDKGADVNAQGGRYGNALQAASISGHKEIVVLLLDKGVDVDAKGGEHGTAVQAASLNGHKEIVALLLDKGVDVDGVDVDAKGGLCNTALQAASRNGHKEIVALLLEKGADINAQGRSYGGALGEASTSGHKEIVELLLDKGADIGDAVEQTSGFGYREIVELLLDKGADIGKALERASSRSRKEVVALLLERGVRVGIGNALEAACANGHKEIVELLLDKGADIGNALEEAAFSGNKELVALLLERGADVGVGNALGKASRYGYKAIVELLLNKGANVGNALEEASRFGHEHVVELLLDKDADVANALQAASQRGQTGVVALLKTHSVAGASK